MSPPCPKSSKEREVDRKSALPSKEERPKLCRRCQRATLTELMQLPHCKGGAPAKAPGMGTVSLHFHLCLGVGDMKGQGDQRCHCSSHPSSHQRMSRDCDLPQAHGNDPSHPCNVVVEGAIKEAAHNATEAVESRAAGEVMPACSGCQATSQRLAPPALWGLRTRGDLCGLLVSLP